jgi:hypothetical protein
MAALSVFEPAARRRIGLLIEGRDVAVSETRLTAVRGPARLGDAIPVFTGSRFKKLLKYRIATERFRLNTRRIQMRPYETRIIIILQNCNINCSY